jgi:hypothetical protein
VTIDRDGQQQWRVEAATPGGTPITPAPTAATGARAPAGSGSRHLRQDETAAITGVRAAITKLRVSSSTSTFVGAAKYFVRGGRVSPHDPPICPTHGRTTQLCNECGKVSCWKCDKEAAPRYLRVAPCGDCHDSQAVSEEMDDDCTNPTLASKSILRAARVQRQVRQARNRTPTQRGTAGKIDLFQRWSAAEGRPACVTSFPTENLVVLFISDRATGEPAACPRGAVAYETICSSVTAIRTWCQHFAAAMGLPNRDPTWSLSVQDALRWAKDFCEVPSGRKAAVEEAAFLRLYDKLRDADTNYPENPFKFQAYFVAMANLWFNLPRRHCLAHRRWKPEFLYRDLARRRNQAELGQDTQPFLWGLDHNGHQFLRTIIGDEKNQAQKATTTRWVSSDHYLERDVPEDLHTTLQKMAMPEGFLLRPHKTSVAAWEATEWREFLDFVARELPMPRDTVGTTSFRRGYATSLREHKVPKEYIKMLGYWRSDASEEYDGACMNARLDVQKRGSHHRDVAGTVAATKPTASTTEAPQRHASSATQVCRVDGRPGLPVPPMSWF